MIKLSIIIILYNEFELIKKCLTSVYEQKIKDIEIIIVDNSSDKNGQKDLLNNFPDLIYVQNKSNLGFGRAVNVGAKLSKGEFIQFLTPDMYLMPNSVNKTLSYISKNSKVGLVACRVFSSPNTQELSVVKRYPNMLTQLYYYNMPIYKFIMRINKNFNVMYISKKNHEKIQFPKAVSGQYMLLRKEAMQDINYFDSRFFLYFEDIDLCKKLIKNKWQIVYLPLGGIVQNGISQWKQKIRITQSLPPYMESLYKFINKYHSSYYLKLFWFIGVFSALVSIPYLLCVLFIKKIFNKKSQSADLIPLWITIVKWHLSKGIEILF